LLALSRHIRVLPPGSAPIGDFPL